MTMEDVLEEAVRKLPKEAGEHLRRLIAEANKPIAAGEPRRHHYVPKFYLRGFANDAHQVAKVPLKAPEAAVVTNVENVAVIKDFYTAKDEGGADFVGPEKFLQLVDSEASSAIRRITQRVGFAVSTRDRAHLALWCALQKVRDPFSRRTWEATTDMVTKVMLPDFKDEDDARAYLVQKNRSPNDDEVRALLHLSREPQSWEVSPHQNEHIRMMLDLALELAPYFFGRPWALVRYAAPVLLTCDRPIRLHAYPGQSNPLSGIGVGSADEIHVPLDRRNVLVIHNRKGLDGLLIPMPFENRGVEENQFIASNAWEEVYCHPDDLPATLRLELPAPDQPVIMVDGGGIKKDRLPDGINTPPVRKGARRYRR